MDTTPSKPSKPVSTAQASDNVIFQESQKLLTTENQNPEKSLERAESIMDQQDQAIVITESRPAQVSLPNSKDKKT